MIAAGAQVVWRWTLYGSSKGGMETTLEEAHDICAKISNNPDASCAPVAAAEPAAQP